MFEIEVTEPLPRLSLNDDQTGLAIVMRRKGRARGILARFACRQENPLQPAEIGQRILAEAGPTLLAEAIREEMATAAHRDIAFRDHRHMHQGSSQRPCEPSEVVAGIPRRNGPEERHPGDYGD